MPYRSLLLMFLVLLAGSIQASVRIPTGYGNDIELYAKSYALIIGVSNYDNFPDLPGVKTDVAAIKASLEKQNFTVLTVMDPDRDTMDEAIDDFIARYGQDINNRLLFYYAGHGYTLKTSRGRELGYILPRDTPLPDKGKGSFKRTAVSMLEMEIYAKQMEAKHAMFMFDSCFSGSLFELSRAIPAAISEKTARPVRQFITAGSAEQEVPDKSIFRRQLVQGLEGEADLNEDGFITGTELAQFLEDTVTNYSRRAQTPQYGKIRDPILDKGDFIFLAPQRVAGKQSSAGNQAPREDALSIELAYWESIKDSDDPSMYDVYLQQYPKGRFALLAKKLKENAVSRRNEATRLAQQRNDEYRKQQEEVARLQAERKQLVQQLAEQEEQARQDLQQQRQAQQSGNMVASVHPVSAVTRKTVVIAPRGEMRLGGYGTDRSLDVLSPREYTAKMAASVMQTAKRVLPGHVEAKLYVADDTNRSLMYESNDNEVSQSICKNFDADLVIMPYKEVVDMNMPDTYTIAYYDCSTQDKQWKEYDITRNLSDSFHMETSVLNGFSRFWQEHGQQLIADR